MARRKLHIRTFGCQMNEYDSDKLYMLLGEDYEPTPEREAADLIIVNTCSVREKPQHKLFSLLGELRELKRLNPELLVGVGGCVAQQEGQRIVKHSSVVDFVFGTHNLSLVPGLVAARRSGKPPQVAVDYRDEWEELPLGAPADRNVSAYVSISRGCNKACTFCIVPRTRGPEVSRAWEEILREVGILAHRGVKEVVLLGQTVNSYGLDLKPRRRFSELVRAVSEIDGVERVRFTSPHPQEFRAEFVEMFAETPQVCRHLHLPLQSGSDRILKLMNRNYRRQRYLDIVRMVRAQVPEVAITTDLIVGFPGETEADFEDTLELMRLVRFDASYSFKYSPRPDTPASLMEDQVPEPVQSERLQRLQALQEELTAESLSVWVGRRVEVLVERGASEAGQFRGRSSQNMVVNFTVKGTPPNLGELVEIYITAASNHTLRGELETPGRIESGTGLAETAFC